MDANLKTCAVKTFTADRLKIVDAAEATRTDALAKMGVADARIDGIATSPRTEEKDPGPIEKHHGMSKDDLKAFMAARPKLIVHAGVDLAVSWIEVPPPPKIDTSAPPIVIDPKEV